MSPVRGLKEMGYHLSVNGINPTTQPNPPVVGCPANQIINQSKFFKKLGVTTE